MMQQDNEGMEQSDLVDPQENAEGGFTINCEQIEASIKEQMDVKQKSNLDRVLKEGNDLLFGEETHYKLMGQLQNSQNISKDLGEGAFGLMSMLLKSSGNSIPGDIFLPAGMILLARASEFLHEAGVPITDDDFEEASHIFNVKVSYAYDPEFRDRMSRFMGEQQPMAAQPEQQGGMPQSGGLLNMTEGA